MLGSQTRQKGSVAMPTTRLLIVTTGGTIAGKVTSKAAMAHAVEEQALVDVLAPTLADIERNTAGIDKIEIVTNSLPEKDSTDVGPTDWSAIVEIVGRNYES